MAPFNLIIRTYKEIQSCLYFLKVHLDETVGDQSEKFALYTLLPLKLRVILNLFYRVASLRIFDKIIQLGGFGLRFLKMFGACFCGFRIAGCKNLKPKSKIVLKRLLTVRDPQRVSGRESNP